MDYFEFPFIIRDDNNGVIATCTTFEEACNCINAIARGYMNTAFFTIRRYYDDDETMIAVMFNGKIFIDPGYVPSV